MSHSLRRIALLIAALSAPAAFAGGMTGLMAGKQYYNVGETVTVSPQGAGTCEKMQLDWGDGSAIVTLSSVSIPSNINIIKSYQKPGNYTVTLKSADEKAADQGCGFAKTVITVVPGGKITELKVTPLLAKTGSDIAVAASGSGTCFEGRKIAYRYRASASIPTWGEPVTLKTFGAGDPWPRTTSFKADKEGQYMVVWMATDYNAAPQGDCQFIGQWPVVTATNTINLPQLGNNLNVAPKNAPPHQHPAQEQHGQGGLPAGQTGHRQG